jgi:hypothetical protein
LRNLFSLLRETTDLWVRIAIKHFHKM